MQPGLSDTDCQIAMHRYSAFIADAQHQRSITGMRPVRAGGNSAATTLRRRLGTHLVQIGQRIGGPQPVESNGLGQFVTGTS